MHSATAFFLALIIAQVNPLQLPNFLDIGGRSPAKVTAPVDFTPASRAPLQVTSLGDVPSLLSGSASFAVRLGSGAFVLGWQSSGGAGYELNLGPVSISDSSSVLASAQERGCLSPLVLYEYEPSPYCKKVRGVCALIHHMRPDITCVTSCC